MTSDRLFRWRGQRGGGFGGGDPQHPDAVHYEGRNRERGVISLARSIWSSSHSPNL